MTQCQHFFQLLFFINSCFSELSFLPSVRRWWSTKWPGACRVLCRAPLGHCSSLIAARVSVLVVLNPYCVCPASCSIHFQEACSGWHTFLYLLIPFKCIRVSCLWLRSWVECATAFSWISYSTTLLEDQVISFTGLLILAFSFRSFFPAFVVVSFLTELQWGATYLK